MAASSFADECKELFNTADLYAILSLDKSISLTAKEIKRAYYKCSLKYHPDRSQSGDSAEEKQLATTRFQALGRVYGILSDPQKREVYDETGVIDDESNVDNDRDWVAYWRLLFKKVTLKDIEKFKQTYKGTEEELSDLKLQYLKHEGDFELICQSAFCADSEQDRERVRTILQDLIETGELQHFANFDLHEDNAQKKKRMRKSKKEAAEAKKLLKEITGKEEMDEKDLVNAIAVRSATRANSFFQQLEEKYGNTSGRDRKKATTTKKRKINDNEGTPAKKSNKMSGK